MSELDDLAAFAVLMDAGSFTLAAEQLGWSKGQLSKRISQLESSHSVKLLHRTTRRLSLTAAGAALLPQAQALVRQVTQARQALSRLKDDLSGPVRVTVPVSLGETFFEGLLLELGNQYPQLQIELELDNAYRDLLRDGFDLAIRQIPGNDERLVARPLLAMQELTCASPAYLERHGTPTTPDALAAHPLLGYSRLPHPQRLQLTGPAGERRELLMPQRLSANSPMALRAAAIGGLGIASFDRFIAHDALRDGRLVPVLADWSLPSRTLYAVYPQSRYVAPKVRALLDYVQGYYAEPRLRH